MSTLTITCHTAGCPNDAVPIVMDYDPANPPDAAQCGPCGQPTDDVVVAP